ncbi:hypothetical protein L0Y40_00405 [Candidatus Wolfebacteria bacterium]|nr:hypothetical protein [Candidatus Wolfebacteria bacterium]
MKNQKLIAVGGVVFLIVVTGVGYSVHKGAKPSNESVSNSEVRCEGIDPVAVTRRAQLVDNNKTQYATTSRRVFGRSTDGGLQMSYSQNGKLLLIEEGLYGETVNSEASYFLENGRVYYFHQEVTRYDTSVYQEDFDPESKSVEVRDFYLDENENLCYWYVNQNLQPVTEEIKDFVERSLIEVRR